MSWEADLIREKLQKENFKNFSELSESDVQTLYDSVEDSLIEFVDSVITANKNYSLGKTKISNQQDLINGAKAHLEADDELKLAELLEIDWKDWVVKEFNRLSEEK